MSTSLGYVFSKKDINVEGGCGLILKYFRYGELEAISPCSLMAFMCPNHGLRLVRQPQRYLSNFFYSQKMLLLPRRLRKTFFDTACLGEQYWSKGYDYFEEMNKVDSVDLDKLKEVLVILCGGSLKSNKVKKSDNIQERAYELFMKKGYRIDKKFWNRSYYFIQKELNYIKIESKHEQHKTPVYSCCNEALNDHLNSIEPVIKYRLPQDVGYISKTLDQYYEDLNQSIKFTNKPSEKYYVKKYSELQQEASWGNTYYRNVYMCLQSFYEAFNPYSKWMRYFQEKIKKWLKFL